MKCSRCSRAFQFSAAEQKHWYEKLGSYVDSYARNRHGCRRDERRRKLLQQKYDRDIESTLRSQDVVAKQQLAEVIDELFSYDEILPAKIHQNRQTLDRQIARLNAPNQE